MRSNPLLLILFFFITSLPISGQQPSMYKRGSLQLPNSENQKGYIWLPATLDSSSFIFFRKTLYDYPLRYDANEIVSFDLTHDSKHFMSVMVPIYDTTMRRIAELHFDGEYKLFSLLVGKDLVFFLIDGLGNITRLVNTYNLPDPTNNFSITYNYEYRSELAEVFRDYPELTNTINNLQYSVKSLKEFLEQYHDLKVIPYEAYPLKKVAASVGASGGITMMNNASPADYSHVSYSPMIAVGLTGELESISGPTFSQLGLKFLWGRFYHDTKDMANNDYILYSEENTNVSILAINFNVGYKLFQSGYFTPYVTLGGEYNLYLNYNRDLTEEEYFYNSDVVYTYKSSIEDLPKSFPGLILGVGTNYKYNSRLNFRLGASYHYFFDSANLMKNSLAFSLSCFY